MGLPKEGEEARRLLINTRVGQLRKDQTIAILKDTATVEQALTVRDRCWGRRALAGARELASSGSPTPPPRTSTVQVLATRKIVSAPVVVTPEGHENDNPLLEQGVSADILGAGGIRARAPLGPRRPKGPMAPLSLCMQPHEEQRATAFTRPAKGLSEERGEEGAPRVDSAAPRHRCGERRDAPPLPFRAGFLDIKDILESFLAGVDLEAFNHESVKLLQVRRGRASRAMPCPAPAVLHSRRWRSLDGRRAAAAARAVGGADARLQLLQEGGGDGQGGAVPAAARRRWRGGAGQGYDFCRPCPFLQQRHLRAWPH